MNNIKVNVKALEGEKDYKHMLISAIEKIDNVGTLEYLYTFISLFLEKFAS